MHHIKIVVEMEFEEDGGREQGAGSFCHPPATPALPANDVLYYTLPSPGPAHREVLHIRHRE